MEPLKPKKKVARVYGKKKAVSKSAAIFLQDASPAVAVAAALRPPTGLETDCPQIYDESTDADAGGGGAQKRATRKAGAREKDGGVEDGEAAAASDATSAPAGAAAETKTGAETETKPATPAPAQELPSCPPTEPVPARPASPSALDDITLALNTLSLASNPPRARAPSPATRPAPPPVAPNLAWLTPLLPFSTTPTHPSPIHTWPSILSPQWPLTKIAESSYAEVYKVHNHAGTSVLKVLALRPPRGPGSRRETACPVADVLSEVRILDLTADIPGFVPFRGAWVVSGRAPRGLVAAWETYDASPREAGDVGGLAPEGEDWGGRSEFPHPTRYARDQVFLVLELGDAGTDLEHTPLATAAELWDVFLGVALALAQGEAAAEFEHRDLHEGNVCLLRARAPTPLPLDSRRKRGFSGLEATLLDYTLSRARGGEGVLSLDLDGNEELFAESEVPQRQIYGRMRAHLDATASPPPSPPRKTKTKSKSKSASATTHPTSTTKPHEKEEETHRWQVYRPYTNVLWLHYTLEFSISAFTGPAAELAEFTGAEGVAEVRRLLDPKTPGKARFASVGEVREWVVARGWVGEGDVAGGEGEEGGE